MSEVPAASPFFWSTPALEQRLDLLLHLVEFGQHAVVLTGPEGAGKTALLTELLYRAPENWAWAALEGAHGATVEAVAARLCEIWELDAGTGEADPVPALAAALAGWARRDRVAIVVLDDADRASDALLVSLLNVLSRLAPPGRPRLLLAGRPALESRLAAPPLRGLLSGLPHSLEMPPLEEAEVADYLAARQQADGLAVVRLPPEAVRRLHRETAGLPGPLYDRFIRAVAAVAAAEAEPAERVARAPALGAPQARKYALVMGLVALVFVGSLLVRALVWRDPAPDATGRPTETIIENLVLPPLDAGAPPPPTVSFATDATPPALTVEAPAQAPTPVPTPAPAPAESDRPAPPAPPALAEAAVSPPTTVAEIVGPTPTEAQPPGTRQAPETPPEPPAAPPSPPAPPAPAAPTESRAAATAAPTDLAWLARQKDDDWLLQVFASDRLPAARAAIARHGLGDRARVIPTTRDGAPWYVVVIGPYPDRARATAAVAGLPQALRAQGPFPKRVSDLERSARRTP